MNKKTKADPSKIPSKPWWDESHLVQVTDEKGRTVQALFPEVIEAKKVAIGTFSLPAARSIMFFDKKKDFDFFEMHPSIPKTRDDF